MFHVVNGRIRDQTNNVKHKYDKYAQGYAYTIHPFLIKLPAWFEKPFDPVNKDRQTTQIT
jgi:hypothetical protein